MKLSKILKTRRVAAGALVLASSEVRFNVDSETADPIEVQVNSFHMLQSDHQRMLRGTVIFPL